MTEETAKRAAELLHELDMLQDIKNATIKDKSHWWGFVYNDSEINALTFIEIMEERGYITKEDFIL